MEKELLSIKEFAAAVGVSQQSIYKRIKNDTDDLTAFVRIKSGKKYISATALKAIYNIDTEQQEQPQEKTTEAAEGSDSSVIIDLLKSQIEAQQKELNEKNKQIQELMQQVSAAQQLINQEQQLHLIDKQKIMQLEDTISTEAATEPQEQPPKAKKKKGIFGLFKRKESATE